MGQSFLSYGGAVDDAIVKVLRRFTNGLRYNKLHRESGKELGRSIWIKTFNNHLKKLCQDRIIERNEESRFKVIYKLSMPFGAKEFKSQINELIENFKKEQVNALKIALSAQEAVIEFREMPAIKAREVELAPSSVREAVAEFKKKKAKGTIDEELVDATRKAHERSDLISRQATEALEAATEGLISHIIDSVAEHAKYAMYRALEFQQENPAWAQFAIDEAARMFRDLATNLVSELGAMGSLMPVVLDRVKRRLETARAYTRTTPLESVNKTPTKISEPISSLDSVIRRLMLQVQRFDKASDRFLERDKSIFTRLTDAYSKHDMPRANVFANELLEIRKMEKMMFQARSALEQVAPKLRAVSELEDLDPTMKNGEVVRILPVTICVLRSISNEMSAIFPEAAREFGLIDEFLSKMVTDAEKRTGMTIELQSAEKDAHEILSVAAKLTEKELKEKLSKLPKGLPSPSKKEQT